MTRFHSDEYVKFIQNIRPDNILDFNKQMQRCTFLSLSLARARMFSSATCLLVRSSQRGRGLSRVRRSLRVLSNLSWWLVGWRGEVEQETDRYRDQLGRRSASREEIRSVGLLLRQ